MVTIETVRNKVFWEYFHLCNHNSASHTSNCTTN